MYRAKCYLKSASPISFSRRFEDKRDQTKDPWEHEQETWRLKLHTLDENEVYIPGIMFKNSLSNCARILAETIPGKGKNTYRSRFESGVIVENDLPLGIKAEEVDFEDVYVSSDGKKGGSSPQVLKRFPKIDSWEGEISVMVILDTVVTKKVFERYLTLAGQIAGIGRFRPERGGNKGRFTVEKIQFEDLE